LRDSLGTRGYAHTRFDEAGELFLSVSTSDEFVDFLTLPAYERLE
jgi:malate synthase